MDLDGLRTCILSNQARTSRHAFTRSGQRSLTWAVVRTSFIAGCDCVEDYPLAQPDPRVLLLTRLADNRPLHTVWAWDGSNYPELVTVYRPDALPFRHQWTNGYRTRVRLTPP